MKKICASLILASSLLVAGQGDYNSELTFTAGGVKPEGNLDLKKDLSFGLRYGTYVQDMFFDMVEVGAEIAPDMEYENSTVKTNVNRFFVNVIKEYNFSKEGAFYALAGLGYEDFEHELFDNDDDGFFNYGIGIKQWVSDRLALKFEARHLVTFDGSDNLLYSVGFVIPFDKKEKPMPVKAEPEKERPDPVFEKAEPTKVDNDLDKDGVLNKVDKCPDTPAGKVVDANGCMVIVRLNVNFAFDKADVNPSYMPKIKEVAKFLDDNDNYSVTLEGHTDSKGSNAYNMALSERRSKAVAAELEKLGVSADRMKVVGFGEEKPIATNATDEGRALNRRVDATFEK